MGEEKRTSYFVTNQQNQPLELHLATRVIVLGPREEVEVREEELSAPQLGALRQSRSITTREAVAEPHEGADTDKPHEDADTDEPQGDALADEPHAGAPADEPADATENQRSVKRKREG